MKLKIKTTGSIMVSAILAVIVWIGIAQSMAMVTNSNLKSIKSGRTALQAQQYADISIDRLKNINYDELDINGAHSRKKIEGISSNDWQDEVTIGAESTIAGSDDAKQRIATVNVYKVGDTLPRYTVEVPLSSQSSNATYGSIDDEGWTRLPNGLILQWGYWSAPNGPWTSPYPTATFPIPFPNKCLSVVRENDWYNHLYGNVGINYAIISVTNTGFTFHSDWYHGHYIAIGY